MANRFIRAIPNTLSCLNLFCGAAATAYIIQGEVRITLILACFCFFLDVMDGFAARMLKAYSAYGKELDSLADQVSFGVLPAAVVYYWISSACEEVHSLIFPVLAFTIAVGAGLRLAKFNIDTRQGIYFHGLPTPAGTLFVLGILFMQFTGHPWVDYFLCKPVFFLSLIVLLPLLLVSGIKLWSLKAIGRKSGNLILLIFIALFLALLAIAGEAAFSLMIIAYLITGVLNIFIKFYGNEV